MTNATNESEAMEVWREACMEQSLLNTHDENEQAAARVIATALEARDAYHREQLKVDEEILAAYKEREAEKDARIQELEGALGKIAPIRVHDGPDYAEVYFSDGITHSTQAMTMNPQDWRDLAATLTKQEPKA